VTWLDSRGVFFALRQKKDFHFKPAVTDEYHVLRDLGFKPGQSRFYQGILCNKGDGLGPFNLAVYWKRKYRQKGPKEPWYILSNLPTLRQALAVYRCRWGIEQLFKDCKSGGYHLEDTKVNDTRFLTLVLLMAMAYAWSTLNGLWMRQVNLHQYVGRLKAHHDITLHHSDFSLGLYGQRWVYAMELCADWALRLVALKTHKRRYFQRGFRALSLIQQAL
jgi:Transposase DDE domain